MELSPALPVPGAVILAALALSLLLLALLARARRRYPYEACESLLSAAEQRFFSALEHAVGGHRIYAKVRLADVVRVRSGLRGRRFYRAFRPIASKHVDYVVCDADSHAVLCVIELDDRSHRRAARQRRDAFVDAVLRAADIPIFHVAVQPRYPIKALRERLAAVL